VLDLIHNIIYFPGLFSSCIDIIISLPNSFGLLLGSSYLNLAPAVEHEFITTIALSILSGSVVGFSLGLIGGGGSVLAVPLLIYLVGVSNTHVAIGTSALAVGTNALINMIHHMRRGHVRVKEGVLFAIPGAAGVMLGAQLGLLTSSENLLILFATFMIVLSLTMLLRRNQRPEKLEQYDIKEMKKDRRKSDSFDGISSSMDNNRSINGSSNSTENFRPSFLRDKKLYRLLVVGFLVGVGAGYFGIGGGFIVVPALMHTIPGLTIIDAIGTSLISVSSFGFLTATRYSLSGDINWFVSLLFIGGGILGGFYGTRLSSKVPKERLKTIFALILIVIAAYIILRSLLNV
jgi:uncharacterized membrane protein YfcA